VPPPVTGEPLPISATPGGGPAPLRGSAGQGTPQVPGDKSLMNSDGLPPARPPEERRSILDLFRN
jgi:penicillin-binding protein 1A